MERSQLPHLPQHIRQRTLQHHANRLQHIQEQANCLALAKKPLPRKTSCKWTKEQRKQNNKLSVARSRIREREHLRLLEQELDAILLRKQQLQHRLNRIMQSPVIEPTPIPIAHPVEYQPLHPEQYHLVQPEPTALHEQSSSEWDMFEDDTQLQSDFSPSSTAEVFEESTHMHTIL